MLNLKFPIMVIYFTLQTLNLHIVAGSKQIELSPIYRYMYDSTWQLYTARYSYN